MAFDDSKYRDPERHWREFNRNEIMPQGPWIANPGNRIFDEVQGFFIVDSVDYETGVHVLRPWAAPNNNQDDADGRLVGVGPGYSSESYRMFLDTSVTPFTFQPQSRLFFYGSMVDHYMVFLGADISQEHGKIISAMYDSSGEFLGTKIPVEQARNTEGPIQIPMVGYTREKLADGELVTVVAYSDDGGAVSQAQLLVKNTKVIRQADASKRYVRSIELDSPFLSQADRQVIEFPLNVPVESLPFSAVVRYSDGTQYRGPIDNGQHSLYGLRDYIATEVGQEFPLVLAYTLADNEISYNESPTANRRLTLDYTARTVAADGAYQAKIFGYPVWVNAATGYRMEYWLYNMDRQVYYNVTPYMELGVNSNPFDPRNYGVVQTFTMALDLNKVDGRFAPFRHVQIFRVALLNAGDSGQANWEVYHTPEQQDGYGRGLIADVQYVNTNVWQLRLANGLTTSAQWLNKLFYATNPLYDINTEARAPEPTHFVLQFLHNSYQFDIAQWGSVLTVNNDLKDGELLYIRWIKRTVSDDLQLGITALPIKQRAV